MSRKNGQQNVLTKVVAAFGCFVAPGCTAAYSPRNNLGFELPRLLRLWVCCSSRSWRVNFVSSEVANGKSWQKLWLRVGASLFLGARRRIPQKILGRVAAFGASLGLLLSSFVRRDQ